MCTILKVRFQKQEKLKLKVVIYILTFSALLFNLVDGRQSFDREPDDRQVNPGEDSVLACRIFDKHRNSQCIWQKDGKPIRIQVATIQ